MTKFNDFRFEGLNPTDRTNKYMTMDRVAADSNKVVIKVAEEHLLKTRYGYALILDYNHVVFLKDWQVSMNFKGNEVLLNRDYFIVKQWGQFEDFCEEENNYSFDTWVEAAKAQAEAGNFVEWKK